MQLSNVAPGACFPAPCSRKPRHVAAPSSTLWPSAVSTCYYHTRQRPAVQLASARSTNGALQELQDKVPNKSQQQPKSARAKRCTNPSKYYDLDFFHYMPLWLQPAPIIGFGVAFFVVALLTDTSEPLPKTALLAACPVALFWGILLFLMPRLFRSFAVDYMRTHPEDPGSTRGTDSTA